VASTTGLRPWAPLVLAFVLAPLLEQSLRQSMVMSPDGAMIFLARPVAATLMVASALLLLIVAFKGRAATTPIGGTS
jgi:putative tricarboxylic transport membrane protein